MNLFLLWLLQHYIIAIFTCGLKDNLAHGVGNPANYMIAQMATLFDEQKSRTEQIAPILGSHFEYQFGEGVAPFFNGRWRAFGSRFKKRRERPIPLTDEGGLSRGQEKSL